MALLAESDAVAEGGDRGRVEDDLALLGVVLGLGEVVDEAAGEHVDQLDRGVADDEPAGRPDRDRDLHREPDAWSRRASMIVPTRAIASCIARPRPSAAGPSSPSSQQVIASPEK